MAQRIGRHTILFDNPPAILETAVAVGTKEGDGPLAEYFDYITDDDMMEQSTWERAESMFQKTAVQLALKKSRLATYDIDMLFAGDLLNQCIGSTFGLRDLEIPLAGVFGACSTMSLALIMSAMAVDSSSARKAIAVTSSHFCTAERQFRFPLDYGGVRPQTAQWTVTGSGAAIIGDGVGPYIKGFTLGKPVDLNVADANNMGAAMAPAAADTISRFLKDTGTTPEVYDMILTGDLGLVGSELLYKLLKKDNIDIASVHNDGGVMIFDSETQDVHAGGSGCGCIASVFCSYIMHRLREGSLKNILLCATGALMSTTSAQQGQTIPGICHLVHITA